MILKVKYIAVILFLGLVSLAPADVQAQERNVEVEIAVLGNCGMCKDRIERAAYSVRGVLSASWDQREQKLTLVYRTDRTDQEAIERAIAKAGHDTENFITDEQTHANLHHCCIYKRNPEWLEKNKLYNEE